MSSFYDIIDILSRTIPIFVGSFLRYISSNLYIIVINVRDRGLHDASFKITSGLLEKRAEFSSPLSH